MIVRNMNYVVKKGNVAKCPNGGFVSNRYLLKKDNMGFTLTRTVIPVNGKQHWHYTHHLEACYCIRGKGTLIDIKTNHIYLIKPGTMYALDKHDDHWFQAIKKTTLICVFNPPLLGLEVHAKNGSYPRNKNNG